MWKKLGLAAVLAIFTGLTLQALFDHSYLGFFMIAGANSATRLMMWDLLISLGLISIWMVRDARPGGRSYLPFLALTLLFGAAGPLLYLLLRPFARRRQRAAGTASLALFCAAAVFIWPYADLRDQTVEESPAAAERGQTLLRRVAEAHGLQAWRNHHTMDIVATDYWAGESPWWPQPAQRLRLQSTLGTFTSRAELLNGPFKGQVWGVQAWSPYKMEVSAGRATFLTEPAPAMEFYLPALQYFTELPFRLLSADVILPVEDISHRGKEYHRVFVTWQSPKPNPAFDQYLLWIDPETLLVRAARYTVRDAARMQEGMARTLLRSLALGTIYFDDYREVTGVMVPFEQTITLPAPELAEQPVSKNFFHRLVFDEVRFDTFDKALLVPDPSRGEPSDRKEAPDPLSASHTL